MRDVFAWTYLWRILVLLGMNAAVAAAAWRVACIGFHRAPRSERLLAAGAVFFAQIIFVTALLGFAGLIRLPVFAGAAALLFLGSRFMRLPERINFDCLETGEKRVVALSPPTIILVIIAGLAVVLMAMWGIAMHPPPGGDGYIYNLFFPATWLQEGRIVYVPLPYGVQAATYYPFNTELLFVWLMLPVHDDFLVNAAQLPALLLGALGVFAMARRAGAGRNGAVLGACLVLLIPGFVQQTGVARVDLFFALWFLLALYFIYAWNNDRKTGQFYMIGICSGLFLGTKSLAVPYSILLFLPFLWAISPQGPALGFKRAVMTGLLMVAFGGFWFVRNALETGNPFYPLKMTVGGTQIFAGAYGREAMQLFHTSDTGVWNSIFALFLGRWLWVFLAGCWILAEIGQFIRLVTGKKDTNVYLFLVPGAIMAMFWWVNPHNNLTNGRFLFPAFLTACVIPALIVPDKRSNIGSVISWAGLAAVVAANFYPGSNDLVLITAALWTSFLDFMRPGHGTGLLGPAFPAFIVLFLSVLVLVAWKFYPGPNYAGFKKYKLARILIVLFVFVGIPKGVLFSWDYQREYKYEWLARSGVAGMGWRRLNEQTRAVLQETGQQTTVAAVGSERAYALFGTLLHNRVVMVNVDSNTNWQFHDYAKNVRMNGVASQTRNLAVSDDVIEPVIRGESERPQVHRRHADADAWIANLKSEGVQLVFCTTLSLEAIQYMEHTMDGFPVEVAWMRTRPHNFRLLWSARGNTARRLAGSRAPAVVDAVAIYAFRPGNRSR